MDANVLYGAVAGVCLGWCLCDLYLGRAYRAYRVAGDVALAERKADAADLRAAQERRYRDLCAKLGLKDMP